ncbi:unnamed protein product [Peronospora belbahrii]|uniref:Uncharacterized protein n=1 Tax=Peronospora belbahrii TaxID=622444 RepID=A0ABN8D9E9_9STRA|nr:unnamed protein product [Peronospora belbahrii]
MIETQESDEISYLRSNPFDPEVSDRDPFPSFEAAIAYEDKKEKQEEEEENDAVVLDWSIDTLAELYPMVFSPLSQQLKNNRNNTMNTSSSGTISFFDDEKQCEILRTPLPAIRSSNDQVAAKTTRRKTLTLIASPSPLMELHRQHRVASSCIASGQQERQEKMDKNLPSTTPKRPVRQRSTPLQSASPLPGKRNRLSTVVTPNSEWTSPFVGRPKWSASPIATLCTIPATLQCDSTTPSSLVTTSTKKTSKQRSKMRLSFGLSPITLPHRKQTYDHEIGSDGER